jgi:hypothetical protein
MEGSLTTDGAATTAEGPRRLHSLGAGGEAPAELGADLLRLLRLPTEALQKLWQVLTPSLADVISKETEELLDIFCAAYRVGPDELGRVIKACRFVIREAAQRDVPAAAVAEDLDRLCPGEPLVKELLLAGYEQAKQHLRREIVKAALVDHGKLLVGLKWRMDTVQASERGMKLQMPVALVTLHFREGAETGRVTLQVLPDMMKELKTVCDRMLG